MKKKIKVLKSKLINYYSKSSLSSDFNISMRIKEIVILILFQLLEPFEKYFSEPKS